MSRFQILSLDGGGLKGIFTASFLASLEANTNKKVVDHFDLIAGTSTGGIIAIALGLGFRPKEILDFYLVAGPKIFPAQSYIKRIVFGLKHIFYRKYSSRSLKEYLQEEQYFGERLLGHSTNRLIIPSFDPVRNDVYIYKTAHHERFRYDYKIPAWRVAKATATAPTYFPIFVDDSYIRLIDGGIWANNPTMIAVTEAMGYLSQDKKNIAILSIGTTHKDTQSGWIQFYGGLLPWAKKAMDFMLYGQKVSANNQAYHLLGPERFLRIDPSVGGNYSLDRINDELIGIGESEARNRINEINEMFFQHEAVEFKPIYSI